MPGKQISKTKVLMISPNGFLGGAERYVLETAKMHSLLNNIAIEILFLNSGQCVELATESGIKTHLIPFKLKLSNIKTVFQFFVYFRKILKNNNYTVIHATMPYAQILIGTYKMLFPRSSFKIVWYQHGPVGGLLDHLALLTPVDHIFFNSTYLQLEHQKMWGAGLKRSKEIIMPIGVAIPNGPLSLNTLSTQNKRFIKENNQIVVSLVGRICNWKGHLTLLKAINELKNKNVDLKSFQFLIIGSANSEEDKKYFNQLQYFIKQHQLEENVYFVGHTKEIENFYKFSDVLLNLSTTPEPFGLTVAEAMAHKTLIIGGNKGGITELLIDGKTGFSFDTTSTQAHVELGHILLKISRLSSEEVQKIQSNALLHIEQNFNLKNCTLYLEKVYSEL